MKRSVAMVVMAASVTATVAALTGLGLVAVPDETESRGQAPEARATVAHSPEQLDDGSAAFGGLKVLLLGDSLAAGEGGGRYLSGTDLPHQRCHRSVAGWFARTAADVTNLACSRAIIPHLTAPQVDPTYNARLEPAQLEVAFGEEPDITLVMLGGNDIRFAQIFNECVLSEQDCTSDPRFTSQALSSAESVAHSLTDAYSMIASRIEEGIVLVPAYPQLFGGATGDCGRISPAEAAFATELIGTLNRSIRSAAEQATQGERGVYFVPDTETALSGHGACAPDPYVHTVLPTSLIDAAQDENAAQELLHPTASGYRALTKALAGWLSNNASVTPIAP